MINRRRYIYALIFILLLSFLLNISLGSVIIPIKDWNILAGVIDTNNPYNQIINYRLSKAAMAIIAGAGLALSGLLMQTMFRNPIVGPYVLGLSSGAGLGVAVLILGSTLLGIQYIPQLGISFASALGSTLSLLFLISFYYRFPHSVNLLITGLMLGIFSGAVISILSYFTQADALQKYVFWSMGNLGNINRSEIIILSIILSISVLISLLNIKKFNALLLGEQYAVSMGVELKSIHLLIIILTGILVGSITSITGPIGFIGLAVPHITRSIFKTQLHQYLIPGSLLIGSILLLLCDIISQVPGSILTLPINSITSLIGAPLVIYLIYKKSGL